MTTVSQDDEASLLRAREIRLRHFAAYVRGASLDAANSGGSALTSNEPSGERSNVFPFHH